MKMWLTFYSKRSKSVQTILCKLNKSSHLTIIYFAKTAEENQNKHARFNKADVKYS